MTRFTKNAWPRALNEAQRAELCEMVLRGINYTAIADHFGTTRNAVSGYASRAGVKSPNGPRGGPRTPRISAVPSEQRRGGKPEGLEAIREMKRQRLGAESFKSKKATPPVKIEELPIPDASTARSWSELEPGLCSWPVGADKVCGARAMVHNASGRFKSYCAYHDRAATQPSKPRGGKR